MRPEWAPHLPWRPRTDANPVPCADNASSYPIATHRPRSSQVLAARADALCCLEPYPNVRFLLRQRKYSFFWARSHSVQVLVSAREVTPISRGTRKRGTPLLRGRCVVKAESRGRQSGTHKPKPASFSGWRIGLGNKERESRLAGGGYCVIRMRYTLP
jgi:hypothetical protein